MKNREKYPNTEDAVKAFEEHNKVCACGCSFEEWLDKDDPSKLNMAVAGVLLGSLLGEIIGAKDRPAGKESKRPSNDNIENVECPFCHQKNGRINSLVMFPDFYCPNCDLVIAKKSHIQGAPGTVDIGTFKSWFDKLTVPANKKD